MRVLRKTSFATSSILLICVLSRAAFCQCTQPNEQVELRETQDQLHDLSLRQTELIAFSKAIRLQCENEKADLLVQLRASDHFRDLKRAFDESQIAYERGRANKIPDSELLKLATIAADSQYAMKQCELDTITQSPEIKKMREDEADIQASLKKLQSLVRRQSLKESAQRANIEAKKLTAAAMGDDIGRQTGRLRFEGTFEGADDDAIRRMYRPEIPSLSLQELKKRFFAFAISDETGSYSDLVITDTTLRDFCTKLPRRQKIVVIGKADWTPGGNRMLFVDTVWTQSE